jgi:hypothetical protein
MIYSITIDLGYFVLFGLEIYWRTLRMFIHLLLKKRFARRPSDQHPDFFSTENLLIPAIGKINILLKKTFMVFNEAKSRTV